MSPLMFTVLSSGKTGAGMTRLIRDEGPNPLKRSRPAQCVTVLVASPALFDVQCKTPRQMELANAFCRYLEMAQLI